MSLRQRRLKADYDRLCTVFSRKSRIRVLKTLGNPPEKYHIEFLVTSLQKDLATSRIKTHNSFHAEIVLTGGYPRMAPQCRMLTPVFHPNIAPHAICIGDHWAAGESLSNLIVRIAEMLAYQSYNVKSPLNGEAAQWAERNRDKLPLDHTDFTALLSVGEAVGRNADGTLIAGGECANCGKAAGSDQMQVCINGHVACSDCIMTCPGCGRLVCLKCTLTACAICGTTVCSKCAVRCSSCGRIFCRKHIGRCHVCQLYQCTDCLVACSACKQMTCVSHIKAVTTPQGTKQYVCTTCGPTGEMT